MTGTVVYGDVWERGALSKRDRSLFAMTISNWRMHSQLLRSSGAPHEQGTAIWVPDGRFPTG